MIEINRHNGLSTAYYLTLKKFIRQGGKSIADITNYNPEKIEKLLQEQYLTQSDLNNQQALVKQL